MSNILSTLARPAATSLASDAAAAVVLPAARLAVNAYRVFPAVPYGQIQQRYIHNPNATGSFWVTFIDGVTPAANAEGCFEVAPGGRWADAVCNEVRVLFAADAAAITAYER